MNTKKVRVNYITNMVEIGEFKYLPLLFDDLEYLCANGKPSECEIEMEEFAPESYTTAITHPKLIKGCVVLVRSDEKVKEECDDIYIPLNKHSGYKEIKARLTILPDQDSAEQSKVMGAEEWCKSEYKGILGKTTVNIANEYAQYYHAAMSQEGNRLSDEQERAIADLTYRVTRSDNELAKEVFTLFLKQIRAVQYKI